MTLEGIVIARTQCEHARSLFWAIHTHWQSLKEADSIRDSENLTMCESLTSYLCVQLCENEVYARLYLLGYRYFKR